MSFIAESIGAFAGLAALDFLWVFYTRNTAQGNAVKAATWAVPLYMLSASVTIGVVHNPWLILPAGAGAFAGTYGAMRFAK